MPRNQGGIHYALVDDSPRLARIIEILKEADHPLSAQEITVRAYDFAVSGKVMLNVSVNIGEIRGLENLEAGYVVSKATSFRTQKGEEPRHPWHDGRPRYWLIAAPGWVPRWTVSKDGILSPCRPVAASPRHFEDREAGGRGDEEKRCQNPTCKRPLPEGHEGPPFCPGPNDGCRNAFMKSLQGSLF